MFFLNFATRSPLGCKKSAPARRFACPNPGCTLPGIIGDSNHALRLQDSQPDPVPRGPGAPQGNTSRIGTPLCYLKTAPSALKWVNGSVDSSMLVRLTGHITATVARWVTRMGSHSLAWHSRFFRDLIFAVLQSDEVNTRIGGTSDALNSSSVQAVIHV